LIIQDKKNFLLHAWSGELMPAISGRQGEAYERNQGGEERERVRGRECEKWMGVFSGKGSVAF
jgi:hypothetical protein